MRVSVIVPLYNESHAIEACLKSLLVQTIPVEIIIVDDGSSDDSVNVIQTILSQSKTTKLLKQNHLGPAAARNHGVEEATGDVLVFVDADMTFTEDFIEQLSAPIIAGHSKGTFTKAEYVANWENVWARSWNYNLGLSDKNRLPPDYPDTAPVFRAILATEFKKVGGFTPGIGWTDDWTLSRKLGYQASATRAVCFHKNPATLTDVFFQARWIGRNEFMTKSPLRILYRLFLHSLGMSLLIGILKTIRFREPAFGIFKLVYDLGISIGIVSSTYGHKNK